LPGAFPGVNFFGNLVTEWASNISAGEETHAGSGRTIEFQDQALVARCRKGDMQAFGLLVAKYQDRIYNLVLRLCGNAADAEELAQETFLKALEKIGQFRGNSRFYTWLFRIAANMAISARRRGGRIKFHSLAAGGSWENDDGQAAGLEARLTDSREVSPPRAAASSETARAVMQALEELDEDARLVVVLRDVEDMDYSQIAEVLDLPTGTVKSRLHRARRLLKEKLADWAP
jgi:RNA polymerase sigma-70 factor (ECF subfamily)